MILDSIRGEYQRYRQLAEEAMEQLSDAQLVEAGPGGSSSVATMAWHVGGNLASRFTDFLTSDGEKPWRQREEEFAARSVGREALLEHWQRGWACLSGVLDQLSDDDLSRMVTIRGVELTVFEALQRSLAHTAYHVGQIVYLAKAMRGDAWNYLSIPPGKTAAYNAGPSLEKPPQ